MLEHGDYLKKSAARLWPRLGLILQPASHGTWICAQQTGDVGLIEIGFFDGATQSHRKRLNYGRRWHLVCRVACRASCQPT